MLKHLHNRENYFMLKEGSGSVEYTQEDFDAADKKISTCMAIVQTNSPFFAVLIKKLLIIPNIFIGTMCTDGNAILYNPKFTNSLSEGEVTFVLEHEILHCVLKHFIRIEGREPKLWNYATDYAINYMLQEMYNDSNPEKAKLPEGVLYDKKYADMSAEDIYNQLEKEGFNPQSNMLSQSPSEQSCPDCGGSGEQDSQDQQGDEQGDEGSVQDDQQDGDEKQDGDSGDSGDKEGDKEGDGSGQGSGSGQGGGKQPCKSCGGSGKQPGSQGQPGGQSGTDPGDGWNAGGVTSPEKLKKYYTDPDNPGNKPGGKELEKAWEIATKKALKQAGNMPGNVKRMIGDVLAPIINWKSQLKRFINALARKNQYKIPNRRHIHSGKYLPGIKRSMDAITNIVVAIDTSGSINDEMIQRYLSEVYDILKRFEPETTYILYIDTDVYTDSIDIIKRKGKPDMSKIKGGGGTAFEPAFRWAEKNLKPKDVSAFLYFTDLYGDTSFKKPKWHHKVIWVLERDSRDLDVPWGKKLVLDSNFKIK